MKLLNIFGLAALFAIGISCKDNTESPEKNIIPEETDTTGADTTNLQPKSPQEIMAPKAEDIQKSQTFTDWPGKYAGMLPCQEGCDGYKHILQIRKDSTYTLSLQAMGIDKEPRVFNGTFHWDTDKNIITLDAEGDHLKFKVMEGMLKKLDKFGNDEQGAPQANYMLNKVKENPSEEK